MSKLVTESVMHMLQEYDEQLLNKKFNPFAFYQIVQLSMIHLNENIKNKEYKNDLYKKMNYALYHGDTSKARKIIQKIKIEIDNDRGLINKYLEQQREEEEKRNDTIIQAWEKDAIGTLSYFSEDND